MRAMSQRSFGGVPVFSEVFSLGISVVGFCSTDGSSGFGVSGAAGAAGAAGAGGSFSFPGLLVAFHAESKHKVRTK